jgi:tripartite-type tricarboxylate transporter receptor subunit TctC
MFGLLLAVLLAIASPASAQQFSGQIVTMIVNYTAGGPTDVEARVVAQHLPKHLQGVTSVVVRNVGGAGGRIGVNQLGEAPAKDRLNIGFFTWNPVDQLVKNETLRVRYNDFKLIAGMHQATLVYIRRDTPPGISKPADVAKARPFRAGALSPTSHSTILQRLALDLLGAKFETIVGYKGLRDVDVAIRQGDIHASTNSVSGWYSSTKPLLIDTGIAMPLVQYDHLRADGTMGRSSDLPDVPTFLEVYKEIWGKDAKPSGEKWEALQLLTRIMDSMYRTVFMPPNAPDAAVAEMRAAFVKLAKDEGFIADFERITKAKPSFIIGAQGERIIADLGNVKPEFLNFLRKYVEATK